MIKLKEIITNEEYEKLLNKIYNYILDYQKEYKEKETHTEFEEGQQLAYYTIADTIKNQILVDNIKLNVDLEKICNDLLN